MAKNNNVKLKSLIPYFIFAIGVIAAYKIITEISFFAGIAENIWNMTKPFFYGVLLAFIFNLPFSGLRKKLSNSKIKIIKKGSPAISAILTLLFFALIIFTILLLFIPYIIKSLTYFFAHLPSYYWGLINVINYINNLELFDININQAEILALLQDNINILNIDNLSSTFKALFGVTSSIFTGILAFISSIYILIEKEKFKIFIRRTLTAFTSSKVCDLILLYTGKLNENFKKYIYVQTIDGLILGTLATIELLILRSPYALLLGVILGIVNYIPYFGSIFGTIFVVIIIAFTQGIVIAAIAAIILLITQQIDGNVIQPKLLGGSFSLSPLLVIISITIGGFVSGIFGMIAAIPIIAVLKDIFDNIVTYYENKKIEQEKIKSENTEDG